MRVEFTTGIVRLQVDLSLVDEANNLNIIGRPHELNSLEGPSGNGTSSTAGFCAPRNFFTFRIRDGGVGVWWGPETEVYSSYFSCVLYEIVKIVRYHQAR